MGRRKKEVPSDESVIADNHWHVGCKTLPAFYFVEGINTILSNKEGKWKEVRTMFDPGSASGHLLGGGWFGAEEKEKEPKFCNTCEKEIENYISFIHEGNCEECYRRIQWNRIGLGSRVKIKYSHDSKVPKKIHGLWVTVVDFNNRGIPEFLCPYTNRIRRLSQSNVDTVSGKWTKQ